MRRKLDIEVKAGIFLSLGLLVVMLTILLMGGGKSLFTKQFRVHMLVPDVGGLSNGAAIKSGGLIIGRVEEIAFSQNYENVRVTMVIDENYHGRVRADSQVRFQTQGVLGDKYLEIAGGSPEQPVIADGGEIMAEAPKDLSAVISDGTSAVQLLKENLANLKVLTGAMAQKDRMEGLIKDMAATSANLKEITAQM
jgi:phospholipid/cholesterol/gamma-HCH transport system substrate-binding protein